MNEGHMGLSLGYLERMVFLHKGWSIGIILLDLGLVAFSGVSGFESAGILWLNRRC